VRPRPPLPPPPPPPEHSKPDPDIVQAALRLSGSQAAHSAMIGDTPYDVEAAARARVPAVALRCGGWWDDSALARATAIYDDPADLLAHFDASPLARAARVASG
jgi:phosphoglycolate phosphatase-like HAD superfamily hydrolase